MLRSSAPMRVAIGTTALEQGLSGSRGLDGIGIYTQALLAHLRQAPDLAIIEVPFGQQCPRSAFDVSQKRASMPSTLSSSESRRFSKPQMLTADTEKLLPGRFEVEVLRSVLTGMAFHGDRALSKKADLFHATDHHIPKLKKTPVIATLMDPVPLMRPDWAKSTGRRLKNWFFKRSVKWASQYITISHAVVPDLVEYFDIPEEKITPIHMGVNLSDFAPVSLDAKNNTLQRLNLQPGFFLFIGTLQPRKNVMSIIEAFEQLPKAMQKEHPLVVVGREGWSSEKEVERLKKLVAEGTAHWLGYVTFADKVILLQTAAVLVFPSLYEGFGLPVLEAFASRLPVITSTVSSLPEVAGDAACLVEPLDIEALSKAMCKVIENPKFFEPLIEKGYLRAAEMTWARCAEKTLEIYKQYE